MLEVVVRMTSPSSRQFPDEIRSVEASPIAEVLEPNADTA
ncbi:hypothetical protein CHCC14437_3146 [Bacillus licheniformis]|nr:hypothetical protein CHCC14437_3146 [Bacillus licheniformis]